MSEGGGSALRELLAVFGIKVDEGELKSADKHVDSFEEKLGRVAATVGEAFAVKEVYEFVESQVEAAAHVQDLADRLDLSATAISNFSFVMKGAGVDADSSTRSLGFLEKTLGEVATKGGPVAVTIHNLGIATKEADGSARPLLDTVADIADAIAKLPDQNRRAAVAMELFGREGRSLLPVLQKGGDAMRDLLAEAGELGNGLGDAYYEDAKKAREETEKLGRVWQSLKDRATAALLPAITSLAGALKDASKWALEHTKTTQALEYAVGALAVVVGVALVDALASAAVAAWALLAPFAPIALAVGAAVWVIQDLVSLVEDGDSVIGRFVETLGGVGAKTQLVEALGEAWKEAKGEIDSVAYALGYLTGLWVGLFKAIKGSPVAQAIGDAFKDLGLDIGGANAAGNIFLGTLRAMRDVVLGMIPGVDAIRALSAVIGYAKGTKFAADATAHGIPQSAVDEVAAEPGPWREPSKHPRVRQPLYWERDRGTQRDFESPHVGGSIEARLPAVAPHVGGNVHVQQTNQNHVVVQTSSDQPHALGAAVGAGVATATEKDLNAALASVVKP